MVAGINNSNSTLAGFISWLSKKKKELANLVGKCIKQKVDGRSSSSFGTLHPSIINYIFLGQLYF